MRVWFPYNQISPMGLEDVIFEVVPLEDPRDHRESGSGCGRSEGAILVDLAVLQEGVAKVSCQCRTVNFIPLSDEDPHVLVQQREDSISKNVHARYLCRCPKRQSLARY